MPFKLSLVNLGNDEPDEAVDLDDDARRAAPGAVDADPDLTIAEALRRGMQHVVDNGPDAARARPE